MTTKFNPKTYQGKDKLYVAIPSAPRISRVWIWGEGHREYRSPENQNPYMARRWEDTGGKRKRTYRFFESLEAARTWQQGIEQAVVPEPTKSGPTFLEIIEEWKRRRFPAMEESTTVRYENMLGLYFDSLLGFTIHEITPQRVDHWLDELKDPKSWTMKSKKRKMFDHELSLLSTILKYYDNYHDDPEFRFPIKQRHKDGVWLKRSSGAKDKQLPEEHFLKFREALRSLPEGKLLAGLATVQYYQALRISEVAALYWEDVYLDQENPNQSRLKVRRKVFWPRKKGRKSCVQDGFKNAGSGHNEGMKEQPLFPESHEALAERHCPGARGLVFEIEGTHLKYGLLQHRYDKAFKKAELPYSGTHVMRHGGCSRLFDERGDLGVAKQILGNSSLRSVEVYARRSKTALTDVAKQHWEKKRLRLVVSGGSENR